MARNERKIDVQTKESGEERGEGTEQKRNLAMFIETTGDSRYVQSPMG